jgi:hypothetical protein
MVMEENKEGIECAVCDTAIEPDDVFHVEPDQQVCSDCVRVCERCSDSGTSDDNYNEVDGNAIWCEHCTARYANFCNRCEEHTSGSTTYIADRGDYWCEYCAGDNAEYCDDCDNYYAEGCTDCFQEPDTIHDYSYRPDLIFHTTEGNERLFFGMEIELECRNGRYDPAEYAGRLEEYDLAYLKGDGSLNDGFEIVTHPMTHDFFKNEATEFWNTLAVLRDRYRVMTWGTSTAGIHIHISRTGFKGGPHMHRFLNLVYSNEKLFSTIAGRESSRWAKFDDVNTAKRDGEDENGYAQYKQYRTYKDKILDGRVTDRYSAVNTQNRDTLELRIFKSTTKPERIKAYMDLAHASVEYTRNLTLQQVKDGALSDIAFITYVRENGSLYEHLVGLLDQLGFEAVGISRQNVSE